MKKILLLVPVILLLGSFSRIYKAPLSGSSPLRGAQQKSCGSPLLFIENKGQLTDEDAGRTAGEVLFYAGGSSAKVLVTKTGLHYQFLKAVPAGKPGSRPFTAENTPRLQSHRYSVNLKNANPDPVVRKEAETLYTERYIRPGIEGNLVAKSYGKIVLENVYPGIDWVLYTNRQDENNESLKYDFIVKPGADPLRIQLEIKDADETYIDETGAMVMKTKLGEVSELPPLSYSDSLIIPTRFKEIQKDLYGFEIGPYDTSRTLVIDPEITWLTYHTGVGLSYDISDIPAGSATDAEGNLYITGTTQSATGIAQNGFQDEMKGAISAFIVKFNSNGQRLWGTYFGGSVYEFGYACATDQAGNIYFTGRAHSSDLPTTPGAHQSALSDHVTSDTEEAYDVFLGKLDPSGALLWATYFGGDHSDRVYGCATDAGGNVFITGATKSSDLPTDNASFQQNYSGNHDRANDAFLAKFSTDGQFRWATYYGTTFTFEHGQACAIDPEGNVVLTGSSSGGLRPTPEVFQTGYGGSNGDAFLAKFNTNGERIWATYLGGNQFDEANACAIDTDGNIYIAGSTQSANFPVLLPFQSTFGGSSYIGDAFLAKFDKTGTLLWSTYYGGEDFDEATSCTIDIAGNVYIAGRSNSVSGINSLSGSASSGLLSEKGTYFKGFVAKFNPGGRRIWGSYVGGNFAESIKSVTAGPNSHLYIVGATISDDLATTPGAFKTDNTYGTEAYFIAKVFDDSSLPAPVVYVNKKATGANNGTSWANAYTSLQDALASVCGAGNTVNEQTQIWVAADTYYPDEGSGLTDGDRELSFELCGKSAVYGGFKGTENHLWERDAAANPTILSGDIDKNGTMDDHNSFGVVWVGPNILTSILDGFTITMGNANKVNCSSSKSCTGGGMFVDDGSSPTIRNTRFINNYTRDEGGGLYTFGSSIPLKIVNCAFLQNTARSGGGGLAIVAGKVIIINSLFADNVTEQGQLGGAGIRGLSISYLKVVNATITGNEVRTPSEPVQQLGGGIALRFYDDVIIQNTIIRGNSSGIRVQNREAEPDAYPDISYSLVQGLDGTSGTGNINGNTDPGFVNTSTGNYQLTPGSPVVNKGDPGTAENLFPANNAGDAIDLAGSARFYGPRIDMGAYELIHESALPVSLAAFNASLQENAVLLSWLTTTEANASHFEIQRSGDARTFEAIGRVGAKGGEQETENYAYTDYPLEHPTFLTAPGSPVYYRLRIVDLDGTYAFSPIASVRWGKTGSNAAMLYPNPVNSGKVTLRTPDGREPAGVRVFNPLGRQVNVPFSHGELDTAHLPAGQYLAQIVCPDGTTVTVKFLKN